MIERDQALEQSWLMIPFYTDPQSPEYNKYVDKFASFLEHSVETTGLKLAVIDDGAHLSPESLKGLPDLLVTITENRGKAYAVRRGLHEMLANPRINPGFIVQYDGDGDQSYIDIPRVQQKVVELSDQNPEIPVLVIGDRYSEDLTIEPNPESIEYRQSILTFFGAIAGELGFPGVRDWVSGARGYTREYAKGLLTHGKSDRYGLEAEQLVVASLIGARVTTAALRESRPRDPHTLTSKWLQNFDVYTDHQDALREQGKSHIVNLVDELVVQLRAETDQFPLDLSAVGENTVMQFTRIGDRYTASLPLEYRLRLFQSGNSFILQKNTPASATA